jgi:hypothetical protein
MPGKIAFETTETNKPLRIRAVGDGGMQFELDSASESVAFHGPELRLSEIMKELESYRPGLNVPKVIITASGSLVVDTDVKHWWNIEVQAPSVLFEGEHHFDLSAKDTAKHLPELKADKGAPGKRGLPGAPGGSLTLRYSNLKIMTSDGDPAQPMDPKQIKFLSKGQKGGKGQNAYDATPGVDALLKDDQKTGFLRNVIDVFWDRSTVYGTDWRPEGPHRHDDVVRACSSVSRTGPHHVETEIYAWDYVMELDGPLGTRGQDSGLRGPGGYGGFGGELKLVDNLTGECIHETQGQKGDTGEPGDPGVPSLGGRSADTIKYQTRFNYIDNAKSNAVIGGLTAVAVASLGIAAAAIGAYIGGIALSTNNKNSESNRQVHFIPSENRNQGGASIQMIGDDEGELPRKGD